MLTVLKNETRVNKNLCQHGVQWRLTYNSNITFTSFLAEIAKPDFVSHSIYSSFAGDLRLLMAVRISKS